MDAPMMHREREREDVWVISASSHFFIICYTVKCVSGLHQSQEPIIEASINTVTLPHNSRNTHEKNHFGGPTATTVQTDSLSSFWTASRVRPFSNEVHSHTSSPQIANHLSLFGWCPSAVHFDKCTRTGHSALAEKVKISNRADYKAMLLCWWMTVGKWTLVLYQWITRRRFWHAGSVRVNGRRRQPRKVIASWCLKEMGECRTKECERMLMHGRALRSYNAAIKRFPVMSLNEKCGFITGRVALWFEERWWVRRHIPHERRTGRGGLTCGLRGELVAVGRAHGQEPIAEVQVETLLCCNPAYNLWGRAGVC